MTRQLRSSLRCVALLLCGGALSLHAQTSPQSGQPMVTLNPSPQPGATQLSGYAYNVDFSTTKVVIYALTNEWYVQPLANAPFTNINPDGSWSNSTHGWSSLVILLVNPANYTPMATEITNPALDQNVLAYTMYPAGPISVNFSGYTWGIKTTGNSPGDQFQPGPNYWSNDPSVVHVAADGLHFMNNQINGLWQSGEVYLTQSLGYGTYTVQVSSHLDQLNQNTVAAPLFIYASTSQELDNEYSGLGGLVPQPYNAQFVVQPYTTPGNIVYYTQPPTAQFTTQMQWASDHVTFIAWNGWSSTPAPSDIIYQWTYTGNNIPIPGQERVHMSLWLLNGNAPTTGVGDAMIIHSFAYQSQPQQFVPITPCRIADTRNANGTFGGPELAANSTRAFPIFGSGCNIPATAKAYSLNVTVVPDSSLGYLTVWPYGALQPVVSTLNSDGRIKANAAVVPAGNDSEGSVNVYVTDPTQFILDIDGYFLPAGTNPSALQFYTLTPCRVADTRDANGPLGGPYIAAGATRSFPVNTTCNIPPSATAYSLNFTAVPHGSLTYITAWPEGQPMPVASVLNAPTGTVVANAALIPAGAPNGGVSVYASNDTDLVIDINGYFAPPGAGGFSFYTATPCRVLDTRSSSGAFSGTLSVNVTGSPCPVLPTAAQGFVLNATVVPTSTLQYLTLWPNGATQPVVSTLNAFDGAITSNMAIVPTTNGSINAYATNQTHLILDISGFFAP